MMIRETQGDLIKLALEGHFDVIVHGCNCFCTMGAGIAKQIKKQFPEAYAADLKTKKGDRQKLGTCTTASIGKLTIVNAYTQFDYRGKAAKADYEAIRSCLASVARDFPKKRIGIPLIGAGLAGGDWKIIFKIIHETMAGADVTVVHFQP